MDKENIEVMQLVYGKHKCTGINKLHNSESLDYLGTSLILCCTALHELRYFRF